ncbi:MAG: NUDIX hydrolase, partial [Verrucomicrobiota bacterium]
QQVSRSAGQQVHPKAPNMDRDTLLQLLKNYRDRYPEEGDRVDQFCDFVERDEDCFERSNSFGHITGSGWIVDEAGESTLLTHHAKLGIWLQPGGHADGNPDVLAVAMEECEEETGLTHLVPASEEIFDLDIHGIPARPGEPAHCHFDIRFLVRHTGDGNYVVSEESHDLAWVPMDNLEDFTDEWSMRRMRRKALKLRSALERHS